MSKAPASDHVLRRKPNFANLANQSLEADNNQVAPRSISTSGESAREYEQPLQQTPPDSVSSHQQVDPELHPGIPIESWPSLSSSSAQTSLVPRTDGSSQRPVLSLPYRTHPRPGSPAVMLAIDPRVVQELHLDLPMLSDTSPTSTSGPEWIGYAPTVPESDEEESLARPGPAEHSSDRRFGTVRGVEMPDTPTWPDEAVKVDSRRSSLSNRAFSPWRERRPSNSSRDSADADEADPTHTYPYYLHAKTDDNGLDSIIDWLDKQSRSQDSTQMNMDLNVLRDRVAQTETLRDTDIPRIITQLKKIEFIDTHLVCTDPRRIHRCSFKLKMRLRCTHAPTLEELNSGKTWRRATTDEQASREYFYDGGFFAGMINLHRIHRAEEKKDIPDICGRLVDNFNPLSLPNAPQEVIESIEDDAEAVQGLLKSDNEVDMEVAAKRLIRSAFELMCVSYEPPPEESRAAPVGPSGLSTADECRTTQAGPAIVVRAPTGEWLPDTLAH